MLTGIGIGLRGVSKKYVIINNLNKRSLMIPKYFLI